MVETQTRSGELREPSPLDLDAFSSTDWFLLTATALTWGSSFVWIEVGLDSFAPAFITLLRIALGVATVACFRKARAPVERADLPAIALLGVLWMAAPLLLFPIAQQWIDSSLAGMINGSVPLFAGLVAAILLRRWPPAKTVYGIALGFVGIVAVAWPGVQDSRATATGAFLVVLASICYGIALNIAAPLQRRYGALPVLLRTQLVALAVVLIPGAIGMRHSDFEWASFAALIPLGCLGTGMAFAWMATLTGRVGAARASVTIYFVPLVAIALGALFRNETISVISLIGTVLVLVGAFLTSRMQTARR